MPNSTEPILSKIPGEKTRIGKHWLDYIDVLGRVIIAIVGSWWAVASFYEQKRQSEAHFHVQIQQQNDTLRSQREASEAELASGLLTYFKCETVPQRLMAQQILGSISPNQAFYVDFILGKCSLNPKDRQIAQHHNFQNSLNDLMQNFLQQLNLARQYRSANLQKPAAQEYDRAYSMIPESIATKEVRLTADKARGALRDGDFPRASDLFEQAFRSIGTP